VIQELNLDKEMVRQMLRDDLCMKKVLVNMVSRILTEKMAAC
jgi:hypothetical protein